MLLSKVYELLNILLELPEDEKAAINHPLGTLSRIIRPTVLRRRWVFRHRDDLLLRLHRSILFDRCVRVDALQQGFRDAVSETEAGQTALSLGLKTSCWDILLLMSFQSKFLGSKLPVTP